MFKILKNKKGQGLAAQYVITFFLVVAVVSSMSIYIRRLIQARIRDARIFMVTNVNQTYHNAALNVQGQLMWGYEPYYMESETARSHDLKETRTLESSLPLSSGVFTLERDHETRILTTTNQAPPSSAD